MSNLRFASLVGADFREANACGVDFHGANMSNANLHKADFRGSDFSSVSFNGAQFSFDTNLKGANMSGADIQGATFTNAKGEIEPISFQRCAELGGQGIGLQVATEKAVATGAVHPQVSSDTPSRAPESSQSFIASLGGLGVTGGVDTSPADTGQLTPDTGGAGKVPERGGPGIA